MKDLNRKSFFKRLALLISAPIVGPVIDRDIREISRESDIVAQTKKEEEKIEKFYDKAKTNVSGCYALSGIYYSGICNKDK